MDDRPNTEVYKRKTIYIYVCISLTKMAISSTSGHWALSNDPNWSHRIYMSHARIFNSTHANIKVPLGTLPKPHTSLLLFGTTFTLAIIYDGWIGMGSGLPPMYMWTQIEHPLIMMLSRMTHKKRFIPIKVIHYQWATTLMISRRLKHDKAHSYVFSLKPHKNEVCYCCNSKLNPV